MPFVCPRTCFVENVNLQTKRQNWIEFGPKITLFDKPSRYADKLQNNQEQNQDIAEFNWKRILQVNFVISIKFTINIAITTVIE